MICELATSLQVPEADCSPISSSATNPCSPSNGMPMLAPCCANEAPMDGSPDCMSTKATCDCSISDPGPTAWVASQRASLARIFLRLAAAPESKESEAASSQRSSELLTNVTHPSSGSKIRRASGQKAVTMSSANSWRADIPGKTESLVRLMSAQVTKGIAGFALLPTLTVCGNYNRKGASPNSGDGLASALRNLGPTLLASAATTGGNYKRGNPKLREWVKQLPTLCAIDHKGSGGQVLTKRGKKCLPRALKHLLPTICATDFKGPYSAEGYLKQTQQRSKPLRDTLVHTTGHRLTSAFAEWWMGWPIGWTASSVRAMAKSRSKRLPRI